MVGERNESLVVWRVMRELEWERNECRGLESDERVEAWRVMREWRFGE